MSTEISIESLRQQLRDLHAKRQSDCLSPSQRKQITRDMKFVEEKLALAIREKIT